MPKHAARLAQRLGGEFKLLDGAHFTPRENALQVWHTQDASPAWESVDFHTCVCGGCARGHDDPAFSIHMVSIDHTSTPSILAPALTTANVTSAFSLALLPNLLSLHLLTNPHRNISHTCKGTHRHPGAQLANPNPRFSHPFTPVAAPSTTPLIVTQVAGELLKTIFFTANGTHEDGSIDVDAFAAYFDTPLVPRGLPMRRKRPQCLGCCA
eukprot:58136-Chlamydomonas_euryale.AAC.5